jgi:hypothetical protein
MKTFITIMAAVLLALSCVTASDARSNAKRQAPTQVPTQSQPTYYDQERGGGDCPIFHCPVNGG